ncbi:MAG: hypothetical protein AB1420_00725 [Bacillota bacterium]
MSVYDLLILILIISSILLYNRITRLKKENFQKQIAKLGKKEQMLLEYLKEDNYRLKKINPEVIIHSEGDLNSYAEHFKNPFIVSKNRKNYLVKIKGDKEAIRFSSSRYRKTLILDCAVFNTDGIIIADSSGKLREFNFDIKKTNHILARNVILVVAAFITGAYVMMKVIQFTL